MNREKLQNVFDEIKVRTTPELDYATTDADDLGDCTNCCNHELINRFGVYSKGIFTKHWLEGINAGRPWDELESVLINHDVTPEQYKIIVAVLIASGYSVVPEEYDCRKVIEIRETEAMK